MILALLFIVCSTICSVQAVNKISFVDEAKITVSQATQTVFFNTCIEKIASVRDAVEEYSDEDELIFQCPKTETSVQPTTKRIRKSLYPTLNEEKIEKIVWKKTILHDIINEQLTQPDNQIIEATKKKFEKYTNKELETFIRITDYLNIPVYQQALSEFLCENMTRLHELYKNLLPATAVHVIEHFVKNHLNDYQTISNAFALELFKKDVLDYVQTYAYKHAINENFDNWFEGACKHVDVFIQAMKEIKKRMLEIMQTEANENRAEGILKAYLTIAKNGWLTTNQIDAQEIANLINRNISEKNESIATALCFEHRNNIDTLNLAECSLSNVPAGIKCLKKLKVLSLANNTRILRENWRIISIQIKQGDLPENLEELVLYGCALKTVPEGIKYLKKLKKINLANNSRIEIKKDDLPESLLELNIEFCYLNKIPEGIKYLKNLKKLFISEESMTIEVHQGDLPKSLEELHFTYLAQQKTLPQDIKHMENLKILNLSYSHALEINSGDLPKNIEELYLDLYAKQNLPEDVKLMENLKILKVESSALENIKQGTLPKNIETLIISESSLTRVPEDIKFMKKLKILDLAANEITINQGDLPENIQELNLSDSEQKTVPADIKKMTNLKKLDLSWNEDIKISSDDIPASVEEINIKHCRFDSIPEWMTARQNLKVIIN